MEMNQSSNNPQVALSALLKKLSREDLLALLAEVLRRDTGLQPWIKSWAETRQGSPAQAQVTVNAADIRRQVAGAFPGQRRGSSRKPREIAGDLRQLLEIGKRYADAEQWANAGVVYSSVAEETMAHYGEIDDYNFEILIVIADCAEPIEQCLVAQAEFAPSDQIAPDVRFTLLQTMYRIWQHLKDRGDLGDGLPEVIAELATPEEMARLKSGKSS
jgi:hypothetical protein